MSKRRILATVWFGLAVVGLLGTWALNIAYITGPDATGYVQAWFANAASSSAAVDLLVVFAAASVLMLVEGARLGWARWAWVFVPLSLVVALAFAFPLFLGLRELALERSESPRPLRELP